MDAVMIGWQSFFFISMYIGTLVSYLFPVLFIRRRQKQSSHESALHHPINSIHTSRVLSHCNCVAAGIFLGICFLNLIPFVEEEFASLFSYANVNIEFPLGQLTVILGLFFVLTLETLVIKCRTSTPPPVLRLEEDDADDDDGDDGGGDDGHVRVSFIIYIYYVYFKIFIEILVISNFQT
jgi:hypothetical protein